jgi:hypothetical protein
MARLKRDKLKGPDVSPETVARRRSRRLQPGAQGAGNEAKALTKTGDVDAAKLEENRRKRLGVGPDHRTPLMRKKRRGSFP